MSRSRLFLSAVLALLVGAVPAMPPSAEAAISPSRPLSERAAPDAMSPCADCPPPRRPHVSPRRRVVRQVRPRPKPRPVAAPAAKVALPPPAVEFGLPLPECNPVRPSLAGVCPTPRCPLTPDELAIAKTAWAYFEKNLQAETGLCNATDGFPSVTMWDQASALYAIFSAYRLGLIPREKYDRLLHKALSTLSRLKLYNGQLPNKAYNTKTGQMVDYANKPSERGIGYSPIDLGRLVSALQAIRACDVPSRPLVDRVLLSWDWNPMFDQRGQMIGAIRTGDKEQRVQEGRLGYQEYANRAFETLGVGKLAEPPVQYVRLYGVDVPVDPRDPFKLGAHTYVVSESYILGAIEQGLSPRMADWARRVYEVQRRRHAATGVPTAVSEDHLDRPPHFVYNTVWTDGYPWRAITDKGDDASAFKSLSTKAAYGWYALFNTPYSSLMWETVRSGFVKDKGYYAGLYEDGKGYNAILTANTNGIILEALLYQKAGRPLVTSAKGTGLWDAYRRDVADLRGLPGGRKLPPTPRRIPTPASAEERQAMRQAWAYFKANTHPVTGFAPSRVPGNTVDMGAVGDQLVAIAVAERFGLIGTLEGYDRHARLLKSLAALPLAGGVAPATLYTTDGAFAGYDGRPRATALGWDSFHLGRLLTGLAAAATVHPELVDETATYLNTWNMAEIVQKGRLFRGDEAGGAMKPSAQRRVGAEQYAARGFALWGVTPALALDGTQDRGYHRLGGQEVPVDRTTPGRTTSEPWLLAVLDHPDPGLLGREAPYLYHAQWERARTIGRPVATGTGPADRDPWVVTDTMVADGAEWEAFGPDGKAYPRVRGYSTGVAYGWAAVYDTPYAARLREAVRGLEHPKGGWYRGKYESREINKSLDARTNALVLEALHFEDRGPLLAHWDRTKALTGFKALPPSMARPLATPASQAPASPRPVTNSRFPVTVVGSPTAGQPTSGGTPGPVATPVPTGSHGETAGVTKTESNVPVVQTGVPVLGWRAPGWLQTFSGNFALTVPLTQRDPNAAAGIPARQGVAIPFPTYQAFASTAVQWNPHSYFFGRLNVLKYLDAASQQPWNPDFTYAFGYNDWHPGTFSLTYENYAGNRWTDPAATFLYGSVVLGQKYSAAPFFPEWLGTLGGGLSYSYTPRYVDAAGAVLSNKHGLHARLDYRVFQWAHVWIAPQLYPPGQQQPWDPDFTYGFGLNDWRPFTLALNYANYAGNRWPGRGPGATFMDGNVTLSGSWGF